MANIYQEIIPYVIK